MDIICLCVFFLIAVSESHPLHRVIRACEEAKPTRNAPSKNQQITPITLKIIQNNSPPVIMSNPGGEPRLDPVPDHTISSDPSQNFDSDCLRNDEAGCKIKNQETTKSKFTVTDQKSTEDILETPKPYSLRPVVNPQEREKNFCSDMSDQKPVDSPKREKWSDINYNNNEQNFEKYSCKTSETIGGTRTTQICDNHPNMNCKDHEKEADLFLPKGVPKNTDSCASFDGGFRSTQNSDISTKMTKPDEIWTCDATVDGNSININHCRHTSDPNKVPSCSSVDQTSEKHEFVPPRSCTENTNTASNYYSHLRPYMSPLQGEISKDAVRSVSINFEDLDECSKTSGKTSSSLYNHASHEDNNNHKQCRNGKFQNPETLGDRKNVMSNNMVKSEPCYSCKSVHRAESSQNCGSSGREINDGFKNKDDSKPINFLCTCNNPCNYISSENLRNEATPKSINNDNKSQGFSSSYSPQRHSENTENTSGLSIKCNRDGSYPTLNKCGKPEHLCSCGSSNQIENLPNHKGTTSVETPNHFRNGESSEPSVNFKCKCDRDESYPTLNKCGKPEHLYSYGSSNRIENFPNHMGTTIVEAPNHFRNGESSEPSVNFKCKCNRDESYPTLSKCGKPEHLCSCGSSNRIENLPNHKETTIVETPNHFRNGGSSEPPVNFMCTCKDQCTCAPMISEKLKVEANKNPIINDEKTQQFRCSCSQQHSETIENTSGPEMEYNPVASYSRSPYTRKNNPKNEGVTDGETPDLCIYNERSNPSAGFMSTCKNPYAHISEANENTRETPAKSDETQHNTQHFSCSCSHSQRQSDVISEHQTIECDHDRSNSRSTNLEEEPCCSCTSLYRAEHLPKIEDTSDGENHALFRNGESSEPSINFMCSCKDQYIHTSGINKPVKAMTPSSITDNDESQLFLCSCAHTQRPFDIKEAPSSSEVSVNLSVKQNCLCRNKDVSDCNQNCKQGSCSQCEQSRRETTQEANLCARSSENQHDSTQEPQLSLCSCVNPKMDSYPGCGEHHLSEVSHTPGNSAKCEPPRANERAVKSNLHTCNSDEKNGVSSNSASPGSFDSHCDYRCDDYCQQHSTNTADQKRPACNAPSIKCCQADRPAPKVNDAPFSGFDISCVIFDENPKNTNVASTATTMANVDVPCTCPPILPKMCTFIMYPKMNTSNDPLCSSSQLSSNPMLFPFDFKNVDQIVCCNDH